MSTKRRSTIVVAWVVTEQEYVRETYVGGGEYRKEFRDVPMPKAVVWKHSADPTDIAAAQDYADRETAGGRVFVFENCSSPLTTARGRMLAGVSA